MAPTQASKLVVRITISRGSAVFSSRASLAATAVMRGDYEVLGLQVTVATIF
jgi:hypothetical protein